MANINALSQANIPVYNVQVPAEGPLHIPLLLDFTANPSYFIDGKPVIDSGNFSMIQTLWIDAINATANVIVVISGINQTIIAKPGTQGYYPVLVPNPFHITISCASVSSPGVLVTVSLINVPIAFGQWPNGSVGPAGPAGPAGPTGPTGPVSSVGLVSTDLTVSGSPITSSGNITANLATTAVTPGTYGDATHVAQFTVDSKGRLTAAGNVVITAGTVSSVGLSSVDLNISGSPVTSSGTITAPLTTTGVTAGSYGDATHVSQITVDAKGRISAASNVAISAGGGGAITLVQTYTASSSPTLDLVSNIVAPFIGYLIEFRDVIPATAGVDLQMLVSTNNGSTFDATANYYSGCGFNPNTGASGNIQKNADNLLTIFTAIDNAVASGGVSGWMRIYRPLSASIRKNFSWHVYAAQAAAFYDGVGAGTWNLTTAINALRFKFSSGNIAQGDISIYSIAS